MHISYLYMYTHILYHTAQRETHLQFEFCRKAQPWKWRTKHRRRLMIHICAHVVAVRGEYIYIYPSIYLSIYLIAHTLYIIMYTDIHIHIVVMCVYILFYILFLYIYIYMYMYSHIRTHQSLNHLAWLTCGMSGCKRLCLWSACKVCSD